MDRHVQSAPEEEIQEEGKLLSCQHDHKKSIQLNKLFFKISLFFFHYLNSKQSYITQIDYSTSIINVFLCIGLCVFQLCVRQNSYKNIFERDVGGDKRFYIHSMPLSTLRKILQIWCLLSGFLADMSNEVHYLCVISKKYT